jgi:hypothetical protein
MASNGQLREILSHRRRCQTTGSCAKSAGLYRQLTLETGAYKISVDTIGMAYNPLDDEGYQQIDEGDRIYVSGAVDVGVFDENELAASAITILVEDKTKQVNKDS